MSALAGFALGGQAMKKPMALEPVKTDHVVQVVTESTGMACAHYENFSSNENFIGKNSIS